MFTAEDHFFIAIADNEVLHEFLEVGSKAVVESAICSQCLRLRRIDNCYVFSSHLNQIEVFSVFSCT